MVGACPSVLVSFVLIPGFDVWLLNVLIFSVFFLCVLIF